MNQYFVAKNNYYKILSYSRLVLFMIRSIKHLLIPVFQLELKVVSIGNLYKSMLFAFSPFLFMRI